MLDISDSDSQNADDMENILKGEHSESNEAEATVEHVKCTVVEGIGLESQSNNDEVQDNEDKNDMDNKGDNLSAENDENCGEVDDKTENIKMELGEVVKDGENSNKSGEISPEVKPELFNVKRAFFSMAHLTYAKMVASKLRKSLDNDKPEEKASVHIVSVAEAPTESVDVKQSEGSQPENEKFEDNGTESEGGKPEDEESEGKEAGEEEEAEDTTIEETEDNFISQEKDSLFVFEETFHEEEHQGEINQEEEHHEDDDSGIFTKEDRAPSVTEPLKVIGTKQNKSKAHIAVIDYCLKDCLISF